MEPASDNGTDRVVSIAYCIEGLGSGPGPIISQRRAGRPRADPARSSRPVYRHGIHATGAAAILDAAHVSTCTFHQHFPTKNALVEAYLHGFEADTPIAAEQQLGRDDLSASDRGC